MTREVRPKVLPGTSWFAKALREMYLGTPNRYRPTEELKVPEFGKSFTESAREQAAAADVHAASMRTEITGTDYAALELRLLGVIGDEVIVEPLNEKPCDSSPARDNEEMHPDYQKKKLDVQLGASHVVMLKPEHACPCCGKVWRRVPAYALITELGYWWNCHCKTTITKAHPTVAATFGLED